MSLARLSAGAGYRYLLRHTASADVARSAGQSLTDYYAVSGNPAGRWLGSGLTGLGDGRGLPVGAPVTEAGMAALFGSGHDPVDGELLGRPYPVYRPVTERIAERVAALPLTLEETERAAAVEAIEQVERSRPRRSAVAGFDLTFTAPKSASVLWALGDPSIQQAVAEAHEAAVEAVLGLVEERFLFTRTGVHSCAQVRTRGLIATAFDHFDTRAGDPNLHRRLRRAEPSKRACEPARAPEPIEPVDRREHTHVVIANKVQGLDGVWRSVDGQVLHRAAVACSEIYDDLFADALATRLPISWSQRDRGPRRTPGFEIDGIDDSLLAMFSRRSAAIGVELDELVEAFTAARGRAPDRVEVLRLRQQATLNSRPDKQVRPVAEMVAGWQARAILATGNTPNELVAAALCASTTPAPAASVEVLAAVVLNGVEQRRSTWTRTNLLAEAARATRHLRLPDAAARIELLDQVVDAALAGCIALDPPALFHSPARFTRPDGASVFDRPEEHAFTTTRVLDAEADLLDALEEAGAPTVPDSVLDALSRPMPGQRLAPDQHAAITGIAGSGRQLDVLVGPAGTGKTRTLAILARAWAHAHGPNSVIGLAPSSAAAAALGVSLGIRCENTAKWLHDHPDPDRAAGNPLPLRAGGLLIVDEAAMATTAHLHTLLAHARAAGAKLLLVGDHQQLDPVEAGGAFGLLAETDRAHNLHALWRFTNRWEANATRALRAGNPDALGDYATHDRLHEGTQQDMLTARAPGLADRPGLRPYQPAHRHRPRHGQRTEPPRPRRAHQRRRGVRAGDRPARRHHRRGRGLDHHPTKRAPPTTARRQPRPQRRHLADQPRPPRRQHHRHQPPGH
jgi:hypothetical protein